MDKLVAAKTKAWWADQAPPLTPLQQRKEQGNIKDFPLCFFLLVDISAGRH